jgi:predicted RNA methylase
VDLKKQFQYFPTPKDMAKDMVDMADISEEHSVLEPSAGQGAIADEIDRPERVYCCELNPANASILINKGYSVFTGDFLSMDKTVLVDRIVMNPPFTKQQDVDHIMRAFEFLKPGGVLVSVVSESPFFRDNCKSVEFRRWLNENRAEIVENDAGAFKESGTMVKTRIIKVCKQCA